MALEPGKIRNVAVVGHRGTGKTALVEALLYQAGAVNRLGTIEAGTTVGDWDEDEHKRQMSIALTLAHAEWQGRKINLVDCPGDPSFQGEFRCALRVVEGALVAVSGVMGVEVGTSRVWKLADELGLARVVFVGMLDRERADFFRTLEQVQSQLSPRCVAVHLPIGAEHELTGIVDVLHMCAYDSPQGGKEGDPGPIPDEMAELAQQYREKLLDAVVETDEALMERYLEGEELDAHDVAAALKLAVTRGEVFPVACGVPTQNLGTHALLDLLVEGVRHRPRRALPSRSTGPPPRHSCSRPSPIPSPARSTSSASSAGRSPRLHAPRLAGAREGAHGDAAPGAGEGTRRRAEFGEGDIGAVAKLKDVQAGDLLTDREVEARPPSFAFPEPVMSFAITPKSKGDEEKVATAIRRLAEEDPTLRLRRDPQTGEDATIIDLVKPTDRASSSTWR